MPNEADGKKDVLLSHGDSATEVNILSRTHDSVHKTASNDRHALFPVWVHATVPFVVLWKRVSWLDTAGHFHEGCYAKALFHDLCGLRGRLRILLVPSWKSGLNRGVGRTSTPDGIRSSG